MPKFASRARKAAALVAVFLVFLLVTIATQISEGAYSRGLGGYPDEPAHFMSGLLIRDYVMAGFPKPPMDYAREYYNHHPTLGIGYWPPLFYVVEAAWMLIFGFSRTSTLLLIATISASLQLLLFWYARKDFGVQTAAILSIALPLIPAVRYSNGMIMTDVFVALLCFGATIAFAQYLENPSVRGSFAFGLLAAMALLAKLSALFLALVPPFSILIARRTTLLKKRSTWVAPLIVAAVFTPWLIEAGEFIGVGLLPVMPSDWWLVAWKEYLKTTVRTIGPLLMIFAIAGAFCTLRRAAFAPRWAAIAAHPLAVFVFLLFAPVGLEPRYLIVSLPSILLLSALVLHTIGRRLAMPRTVQAVALSAVCLTAVFAQRASRLTLEDGIPQAAAYIQENAPSDAVILVSSPGSKEGRMVAELAARENHRPGRVTLRSSKILAETDWNVTRYRQRFITTSEVEAELERRSVQFIIVDSSSPTTPAYTHHDLLKETLNGFPGRWVAAATFTGENGVNPSFVFVRAGAAKP